MGTSKHRHMEGLGGAVDMRMLGGCVGDGQVGDGHVGMMMERDVQYIRVLYVQCCHGDQNWSMCHLDVQP